MKKAVSLFFLLLMIMLIFSCSNKKEFISVYFCYYEDCAGRIGDEISQAKESVYFMSYTLTNGRISSELIIKKKEGLDIRGIIEKSNINAKNSRYELMRFQGVDVRPDKNSALMHHKVFIIDRNVVITGSFNPTEAGDERNDENMVIIRDKAIAEKYLSEFNRIFDKS